MLDSSAYARLKVLTPALADRLRVFNQAARALQFRHVRLLAMDPINNRLSIDPDAAQQLIDAHLLHRHRELKTAGSSQHFAEFRGVTLFWKIPISTTRPQDWTATTLH
jgi:hypothetical protein